ncbi:hypothetical protein [Streptomyces sp. AC550_RSS872]|uniref:hypothetical protein n=1 Tax=Streptomyces sp. AC550_RSS872 TaxID=2823689 RepID=UPI001C25DAB0|nr:hypothetical protein [Streptomyces sp. AC550_RSS872]
MTQPALIRRVRGHRPRLLDLYCCQGGAAKGYVDAGFEVTGVDLARRVLGVPWMNRDGIRECIPPAYTQWIGRHALTHLAAPALGVAA